MRVKKKFIGRKYEMFATDNRLKLEMRPVRKGNTTSNYIFKFNFYFYRFFLKKKKCEDTNNLFPVDRNPLEKGFEFCMGDQGRLRICNFFSKIANELENILQNDEEVLSV